MHEIGLAEEIVFRNCVEEEKSLPRVKLFTLRDEKLRTPDSNMLEDTLTCDQIISMLDLYRSGWGMPGRKADSAH